MNFSIQFYNLDASISVGYLVNSRIATAFRIWPAWNVGWRYCRSVGSQ